MDYSTISLFQSLPYSILPPTIQNEIPGRSEYFQSDKSSSQQLGNNAQHEDSMGRNFSLSDHNLKSTLQI